MKSTLHRRGDLVHLAHLLAFWQARRGPRYQHLEDRLKAAYDREGRPWDDGRDFSWIRDELRTVRDAGESYPPVSYYRWRVSLGLPIWAAVAAGMHLTRDAAAYREELDERQRMREQFKRLRAKRASAGGSG